jgi:hypothetical protein
VYASEAVMNCDAHVDPTQAPEFAVVLRRAEAEFLEMPGLKLTESQAARLWASNSALCRAVLMRLVETRFLIQTRHAAFTRP